jgi:small-conductance mechanosensitive channel
MRLVEIKASVPKDSDLSQAIRLLYEVGEAESRRVPDKEVSILVAEIGEYAVDLLLRVFTPNDVWIQARSELRQQVVEEFQRRGLELAIPAYKNL